MAADMRTVGEEATERVAYNTSRKSRSASNRKWRVLQWGKREQSSCSRPQIPGRHQRLKQAFQREFVEKVGTSAKKRNEVFSLQLLRINSIGNACYAG